MSLNNHPWPECPRPRPPVPGSISGVVRGHVLTSATGSYRSICAAGLMDPSRVPSTQIRRFRDRRSFRDRPLVELSRVDP